LHTGQEAPAGLLTRVSWMQHGFCPAVGQGCAPASSRLFAVSPAPALGAQTDQLEIMTLQGKPMLLGHGLLQDVDSRVAELHLCAARHADEMVVMRPSPDVLVPGPSGTRVLLRARPADDPRLHEQREIAVDRYQGEAAMLGFEELQQVVCLEVAL